MNNEKWLKTLEKAEITPTPDICNGEITSVKVRQKDGAWRICLSFEKVIPWPRLEEITKQIKDSFINDFGIPNVLFTLSYSDQNVDIVTISDYYRAAINSFKPLKATIIMLEEYPYLLEDHTIVVKVATIYDKNNVDEHLSLIKAFFKNYGLTDYEFTTRISEDEKCLKDLHHEETSRIIGQNEARSIEQYIQKKVEAQAYVEQTTFSKPSGNKPLTILLSEVPFSSLEVEEFKQTRGTNKVEVTGVVVKASHRDVKSKNGKEYKLFEGVITDFNDSIIIKRFYREADMQIFENDITPGKRLVIQGNIQWDDFVKDVIIMCDRVSVCGIDASRQRFDASDEKRVELHAHTKMSVLDSILDIEEYVATASRYGHKALAVTDHANCHVFPDLFKLCEKYKIKPIAGVEAYFVDDLNISITHKVDETIDLKNTPFVVFDLETTGLCVDYYEIIEIGAVKIKNGMIIDSFSSFIKPKRLISQYITNLTNINNDMVKNAPSIEETLPKFLEFIHDSILVAHNADFDTGFLYEAMRRQQITIKRFPCIDTLTLARVLYPENIKNYKLETIAKYLKVEVETQHRAIHDARTTSNVFISMLTDLYSKKIYRYEDINSLIDLNRMIKIKRPTHLNILVKNHSGLKNFYKIISDSHTTHFNKEAMVLKSVLNEYRDGLLIGSGCANGEIFDTALEKSYEELLEKVSYYDFLEVQPPECYYWRFEEEQEEKADEFIKATIKKIIKAGNEMHKLVVATGDVHELLPEDVKYRNIYLAVARPNGGGPHPLSRYKPIDMHFRTTTEMLKAFDFLSADVAKEIVITNTNLINDMIETYPLFPKKLYVPRDDFMNKLGIPSMKQAVYDISYQTAHEIYGNDIPLYVKTRLDRELDAIIGHGFYSVYFISHLLVKNSNDNGYIVGSRGSVGSSFVATMMKITEVNPLKPHYLCPHCHFSLFKFTKEEREKYNQTSYPTLDDNLEQVETGMDLKDAICPICGTPLNKEGVDIAFETFLGFEGEKTPDIDLNFSGEYQPRAHLFCQETFGFDNAFRAGTISTVMDKTAFAFTRDFFSEQNLRKTEIERIANFIAGAKRTTGQHPGGIVVVPDNIEYTDIIPVQYPPLSDVNNIEGQNWRTSHFDYHSFEKNLLKLDILGHVDPTVIKMLMDFVHNEPDVFPFSTVDGIPYVDDQVLSLFSSKAALNINGDDCDQLSSGTRGIPEFGTNFVRGMLETIKPQHYSDIIKVSGLSHGTDVWTKNAEDLVLGTNPIYPKIEFKDVIGCRDDIMIYLLNKGLPAHEAFLIMEDVRKGRGLKPDQEALMLQYDVPDWYIYSCKKIKYMFPKAHATAYVIMALRIGWFKVHHPIYYYAAFFSKRAKEFDPEVFANGKNAIRNKINEFEGRLKKNEALTNKESDLLNVLYIALEMVLRGFSFKQINLEKSKAIDFVISEDKKSLYLPFISVDSLGSTVAISIETARDKHLFTSKKDFEFRTSVNKKQYLRLNNLGVFDNLPDNDTLL